MDYLFVYGTLRVGSRHPMAQFLAEHARHIGNAKMAGRLYDLGRYPGMVAAEEPDDWVIGDVFHIENANLVLSKLDDYEGACGEAPRLFERKRGPAQLNDGRRVDAWFYDYKRIIRPEAWIRSGNYGVGP